MDKYLVSLAFLLLFLETGWLLQDLKVIDLPSALGLDSSVAHQGQSLGMVKQTKHKVRTRPNSSLVWEETLNTQNLYAYDSVLTLDESSADLSLRGDSLITLNENTLVTIEPTDNADEKKPIRIRFKQGTLRANFSREPQSIQSGEWVVEATANTKFTLRSRGPDQFELETSEGQTRLINEKNPSESKDLKAGQSVVMANTQISDVHEILIINWVAPADGLRIYTHESKAPVSFSWEGDVTDLVIYEHESLKPKKIQPQHKNQETLELPLGNYVSRLENHESLTFSRSISIWPAPRIYLVSPLDRLTIRKGANIDFIWSNQREVSHYIWQVASDKEFNNIIKSGSSAVNSTSTSDLPEGHYFWRVKGEDEQGFAIPEMYLSTFNIMVSPLEAPKLKSPVVTPDSDSDLDDQGSLGNTFKILLDWLIPNAMAQDLPKHYSALFEWEEVSGADSYLIEISQRPDFRQIAVSKSTKKAKFRWRDFKLSKYYWRVAALAKGTTGLFSDVAAVDLTSIPVGAITPSGIVEAKKPATDVSAIYQPKLKIVDNQYSKAVAVKTDPISTTTTQISGDQSSKGMAVRPNIAPTLEPKVSDESNLKVLTAKAAPIPNPTPISSDDLSSKTLTARQPTPSPTPTQTQLSGSSPTPEVSLVATNRGPVPVPIPTPTPPIDPSLLKIVPKEWSGGFQFGGRYDLKKFKGSDFTATENGFDLPHLRANLNFLTTPTGWWHLEGEYQKLNLKVKDPLALPFQESFTKYGFRTTIIRENPIQDEKSWGFSINNQNLIYKRNTLESLAAKQGWMAGPLWDWSHTTPFAEQGFQVGVYLGEAQMIEGKVNRSWIFDELIFNPIITVEGKIGLGFSNDQTFWYEGSGFLLFGVRW